MEWAIMGTAVVSRKGKRAKNVNCDEHFSGEDKTADCIIIIMYTKFIITKRDKGLKGLVT